MTMAPDRTRDSRPRVRAFHVLSAMRERARGMRAVVLNLSPRMKGSTTFFRKPPGDRAERQSCAVYPCTIEHARVWPPYVRVHSGSLALKVSQIKCRAGPSPKPRPARTGDKAHKNVPFSLFNLVVTLYTVSLVPCYQGRPSEVQSFERDACEHISIRRLRQPT